jgi:hypothetical protein
MTDRTDEQRRADAARSRARYKRQVLGLGQYKLELPTETVVDILLEAELIDIAECENHARVERALGNYLLGSRTFSHAVRAVIRDE